MASGYKAFRALAPTKAARAKAVVGNAHLSPRPKPNSHADYVAWVMDCYYAGIKLNKVTTQKKALEYGIDRQNLVKELTELAIVRIARDLAHTPRKTVTERFQAIADLYINQTNLSHRTSLSVLLQQYSTPAPIAYLMGVFCGADQAPPGWTGLEPSAGNGLLTIAGNPGQFYVNEIDETRRDNLLTQHYAHVTGQDGTLPFTDLVAHHQKRFDAVLTNPPFGRLPDPIDAGPATIRDLDHWMAINALDAMTDTGRAAIIVGGHTQYDEEGRVKSGKNRVFLNYLYHHYNVVDALNIDGDLYARQGTSFDVRLILIAGRKATPEGYSRFYDAQRDACLKTFDALLARILPLLPGAATPDADPLLLEAEAEAAALLLLGDQGLLGLTTAGQRFVIDTYGIPESPQAPPLGDTGRTDEQNADIFMAVADKLLAAMNKPQSAVQFSRLIGGGKPFDALTGEPFKGANAQLCRLHNHVNGYQSNQFVSEYDVSVERRTALFESRTPSVDLMLKYKGRIYMRTHFNLEVVPEFAAGLADERPDARQPLMTAEQIVNDFPPPAPPIIIRENLVANSAAAKKRRGKGRGKGTASGAYISNDTIEMFPATHYRSITQYYSTLFHEMIHATGIITRLNRPYFRTWYTSRTGQDIALEEITAEIGAAFLCAEAGFLYQTAGTNASYAYSYAGTQAKVIGSPAHVMLLNGIAQAQRAADYVLGQVAPEPVYQERMKTLKNYRYLQLEAEAEAEAILLLAQSGELGMPYMAASAACNRLDVDTPDAMAGDVKKALDRLKERVGDVDEFVREKLGYTTPAALCKAMAAEQIDAVALAIDNIERLHQGIIIGDQTGIGKGRQAAAMIRYACHQGQTPVFCTEKPNLFTDLYRDLTAIGSGHLKPFILNSREDKSNIRNENGDVVFQAPLKEEQDRVIKSGNLPNDCNFIMLTYSQMNSGHVISKAGVITALSFKAHFVKQYATDSVVILDESHNASGDSTTGKVLSEIITPAAGVVYLSATFAKRPDNMYIYAMKTAMQEANLSPEEYAYAFARGGVALQEVVAGQLVGQGQMIRRQRGFEGIQVNYITLDETAAEFGMPDKQLEHRAIADELTRIIRRIIAFQEEHVKTIVKGMDKAARDTQSDVAMAAGSKGAGVDNSPYFSKVFNVINQMLFAIKAEAVADRAIQRLREGLKPVIAFSSTMGSFVEELYTGNLDAEDATAVVNADFTSVLQRGLDGVLRITKRDAFGKSTTITLSVESLSVAGQGEYRSIQRDIRNSTSGLVLSPIDLIKQRITDAGFSVAEVTGRKLEMQLTFKADLTKEERDAGAKQIQFVTDIPKGVRAIMPLEQQKAIIGSEEHWEILAYLQDQTDSLPPFGASEALGKKMLKASVMPTSQSHLLTAEVYMTIWLHYFLGSNDWYITEYDRKENLFYGFTVLGDDWTMAEWGYIAPAELFSQPLMNLDFFWSPKSLIEVKQESGQYAKIKAEQLSAFWPQIKAWLIEQGYRPADGKLEGLTRTLTRKRKRGGLGRLMPGAYKTYFETISDQTPIYERIGTRNVSSDYPDLEKLRKSDVSRWSDYAPVADGRTLPKGMTLEVEEEILMDEWEGDSIYRWSDINGQRFFVIASQVQRIEPTKAVDSKAIADDKQPGAKGDQPVRAVGIIKVRKKENVSESFRRFNDNEVDVLLINQSGSTGASAHAVATKKVPAGLVKKRVMIVLQAELDINTEVQKRGRINRTGQILKPVYDYVTSAIPAERRLMMMLQKKLKSLDANTTSNQRNSEGLMQSDDFLNKYGDEVVSAYLDENKAVNHALGDVKDGESSTENIAHKASGRVAVLPTDGQETFYADIIDGYKKFVRRKIERDEYDLEVSTLDLGAKPIGDRTLLIMGKGGLSAFGDSTYLETMEVNNLRKPYKPEELTAMIDANLEGRSQETYAQELLTEMRTYMVARRMYYDDFYAGKLAKEVDEYTQTAKFGKMNEADQADALEKFRADKSQGWMQKKEDNLTTLEHNATAMEEIFDLCRPGRMMSYQTAVDRRACCILGISVDRKKKLPFDTKNVDVLVAVASSQKIMTLGLSNVQDVGTLYAIKGASTSRFDAYDKPTLQNLWRIATKNSVSDRTTRLIVTGNLLQAYKSEASGKIVTFTTFDGRQRRGIMMPEGYNPQAGENGKSAAPQEIDVPVLKALKIIQALPVDKFVTGSNGLTIRRKGWYEFMIIVPQGRGKSLFTDPSLIGLMKGQDGFNKVSNNMVGLFAEDDLEDVCYVLQHQHSASIKVLLSQLSLIAGEIDDNKGNDYVEPLPQQPEPDADTPPVDDGMALLLLEAEAEAEALLLLLELEK